MHLIRNFLVVTTLMFLQLNVFPTSIIAQKKTIPTTGVFPDLKIQVGDDKRYYRLVVPKTVNLEKPATLVLAFHGLGIDSKDLMPRYSKLDELAEKEKFILVYPASMGQGWGLTPRKVQADLKFFDQLLTFLKSVYKVDEKRIYILGMSNGGYFAHLLAKERSTTIAAVCAHSTALGLQTLRGINAERKFPVMIVHGTKDSMFSLDIAHENRDKYLNEKHEVEYVEVPNLGHNWASDININDKIWDFFQKHPLK